MREAISGINARAIAPTPRFSIGCAASPGQWCALCVQAGSRSRRGRLLGRRGLVVPQWVSARHSQIILKRCLLDVEQIRVGVIYKSRTHGAGGTRNGRI